MKEQLEEAVAYLEISEGESVTESVASPESRHLRETNLDCEKLTTDKSESFHFIEKILHIMKRDRQDLETDVSYLCTRVSKSDFDDWKKLRRIIAFIKVTINEKRVIGAKSLSSMFTWVDAAHAVNPDMKSQMEGSMSMGIDVMHGK